MAFGVGVGAEVAVFVGVEEATEVAVGVGVERELGV